MAFNSHSIDAVIQRSAIDMPIESTDVDGSAPAAVDNMPLDSRKDRGKRRIIFGLHKIASSPSLARIKFYRSGTRPSMSCISLHSSYGEVFCASANSEKSLGQATPPAPVRHSSGPTIQTLDARPRARTLPTRSPVSIPLPGRLLPASPGSSDAVFSETKEDYFSCSAARTADDESPEPKRFDFCKALPSELRIQVLQHLSPREVIRCSAVSRSWHDFCFDGQLWRELDMLEHYCHIPADSLVKIISRAGPFVRDLNLRGCIQMRDKWSDQALIDACRNLEYLSLDGCVIDKTSLHCFLLQNTRLVHINLSRLAAVTNSTMRIISQYCPRLEYLNVTWCQHMDTRGILPVAEECAGLKDLRAGEIRGWDDIAVMNKLHAHNSLERLMLTNCDSLTDACLQALIVGTGPEFDLLTGRVLCPPRKLKHLGLDGCRQISDAGLRTLAHHVPNLEGLQLSKCIGISDASLGEILPTLGRLTHINLEELEQVTNATLHQLSKCPSVDRLLHINVSYCEAITDSGMVPLIKACKQLQRLDMDNTRISDLCLVEAAALNAERNRWWAKQMPVPERKAGASTGLRLVVYDCPNVTWMGVREILSRNTELAWENGSQKRQDPIGYSDTGTGEHKYRHDIIALKAFYTWQPTIDEHTKRVTKGDYGRARRLERKWAEFMMLGEEAAQGGRRRRRRRRIRDAYDAMAGEEGLEENIVLGGGRRRARSAPLGSANGCIVM